MCSRRVPPPPDCVAAAEEVLNGEVGNGVGTALSSAFNVMAFTHELDLNANGESLMIQQ